MKLLNNSIFVGSSVLIASSLAIKPALSDQYFQPVETDAGKTYCIGIERGFLDWPGPQFSDGGNQGKWSLDDQDWYVGYQTANRGALANELSTKSSFLYAYATNKDNNIEWRSGGIRQQTYYSNSNNSEPGLKNVGNFAKAFDSEQCESPEPIIPDLPIILPEILDKPDNPPDIENPLGPTEQPNIVDVLGGINKKTRLKILGRVTNALLIPRNVTASGLATQAYVNDLSDTILERLPSRQLKTELSEVDSQNQDSNQEFEIGGKNYFESSDLQSSFLESAGTRGWVRGFGGSNSPSKTGGLTRNNIEYPDVYNNFYSTHGGFVVGIDTSITENIQLGFFGNYGNISLQQFSGDYTGGGSWNPEGWGGGISASYWTESFYIQGLFGATSLSGTNIREVKIPRIINENYRATKNITSYMGALRIGAPLTSGRTIIEPQFTAIWNGIQNSEFTESGQFDSLALKTNSYYEQFLQTALGAKLSWPIPQKNGNLFTPTVRVAWLADWNTGNGDVSFERANAKNPVTAKIPSNQSNNNGILLEGGIDYAIFNGSTSGWKLYFKGGAKIWANKSTDWRTSGGLTFQF